MCNETNFCIEEWYLPNLFLLNHKNESFANAHCHPECSDCHDCHDSSYFGTVVDRDRVETPASNDGSEGMSE